MEILNLNHTTSVGTRTNVIHIVPEDLENSTFDSAPITRMACNEQP